MICYDLSFQMVVLTIAELQYLLISSLNMNTMVPRIYLIAVKGENIQVTYLCTYISLTPCLRHYHVSVCWVLTQCNC